MAGNGGKQHNTITYNGAYFRDMKGPVRISISDNGSHPELTTIHEIGHFLDHAGIRSGQGRPKGFASGDSDPIMAEWRRAVEGSRAYSELVALLRGPATKMVSGPAGSVSYPVNKEFTHYLLTPHELFARSYAQYIAARSKDPKLLAQLNREREKLAGRFYYPRQWDDDDFTAIAEAMDRLFRKLGWMK